MINKNNRNGRNFWIGKIITQSVSGNGKLYLRANLSVNGKLINFNSHRLIAKEFVDGRTSERNSVNHIDGNPQNNIPSNLEWCTCKENKAHAIATGLQWYLYGEQFPNSALKEHQVEEILHRYFFNFERMGDIGKDYGVTQDYVSLITRGKRGVKVFARFIEEHKEHYNRVAPVLKKRNGTNLHKFETRMKEALNG